MNDPIENQQKHLEFLLADFNAIKAEIARRSNLQRVVLAAYIGLFAVVGKQIASYSATAPLVIGLWFGSALSLQFYTRESLEITRLGSIIRERIAPVANKILNVPIEDLLPSQTNSEFPKINSVTSLYNIQFKWIVFFCLPLLITILYFSQDWSRISKLWNIYTRGPYMAICATISGLYILSLLKKYAWPKKKNRE